MFLLGKCSMHKRNKRKDHVTAKDKRIYLFLICWPPSLQLVKKLRCLLLLEALLRLLYGNVPHDVVLSVSSGRAPNVPV